jgi:iron complex outermembrane receptor protein
VNLLKQHTRDVAVPGFARIDAEAPPRQPRGTLPGSATDSQSGSIGGGYFWTQGRAGAALSRYESDYGVPTGETPATSIQMRRTRLDLEAEVNQATGFWRSVKARFGASRYHHAELSGGDTINTRFTNNAWEGRLELGHAPGGPVSGTIGIQAAQSDFAAAGAEVATPPSLTRSGALFALEELTLGRTSTVQLGARYEGQSIRLGEVPAGRPAVGGFSAQTGERKGNDGLSGSLGIVVHPAAVSARRRCAPPPAALVQSSAGGRSASRTRMMTTRRKTSPTPYGRPVSTWSAPPARQPSAHRIKNLRARWDNRLPMPAPSSPAPHHTRLATPAPCPPHVPRPRS